MFNKTLVVLFAFSLSLISYADTNHNPHNLIITFNNSFSANLEKEYINDFGSFKSLNLVQEKLKTNSIINVKPLLDFLRNGKLKESNKTFEQIYIEHAINRAILNNRSPEVQKNILKLRPSITRTYIITFDPSENIENVYNKIKQNSDIEKCSYDNSMSITSLPSDTYVDPDQDGTWSSGSFNNSFEDLWGAKNIEADKVWGHNFYGDNVLVAIVDTGIDYNHPDLAENVWKNVNEIPNNNIDDDNNGYIDDYYGFNFDNNTSDVMDFHGHGTHVSGTIAAPINGIGIVGIAPHAKVMACPFLSAFGSGGGSGAINAFYYAVDNGANVISNSWGSTVPITDFPGMDDAIAYAEANSVVVVFAAGNSNIDITPFFPANIPEIITVGALTPNLLKASYSNYGIGIDVFAPGSSVLSLRANTTDMYGDGSHLVGQHYIWANGTSMACPHVSGVVALMMSAFQNDSNAIRNIINNSTNDLGEQGQDEIYGNGAVDAYTATFFSETSNIYLEHYVYNANITSIPIVVRDGNFIGNSLSVSVSNNRENLNITLNRQNDDLPFFTGNINTSFIGGLNVLQIQDGDIVTITYHDEDSLGQPQTITKTLNIDGLPPIIDSIQIYEVENGVIVDLTTNELSTVQLVTDEQTGSTSNSLSTHRVYASAIESRNHTFTITATDSVGNQSQYSGNFTNQTHVLWVAKNGSGDFTDIQTAINNAPEFSEIRVIGENYIYNNSQSQTPMLNWNNKILKIKGGYSSVNGSRDLIFNKTILNGTGSNNIAVFSHNLKHIPVFESEFSGFEINNFGGVTAGATYDLDGSFVSENNGYLEISNCIFSNGVNWGAIKTYQSDINISKCSILNNNAVWPGAGLASTQSTVNVSDCIFNGNDCRYAPGISSYDSDIKVVRTRFSDNISTSDIEPRASVALHILEYSAKYQDCIFDHNIGNGVFDINGEYQSIIIDNCTFYGNTKASSDYLNAGSIAITVNLCEIFDTCIPLKLYNSILWNEAQNSEVDHDWTIENIGNVLDIKNCIIRNNTFNGQNILVSDPLLIAPNDNIFDLSSSSPAIDSGFLFEQRDLDFDGSNRVVGTRIDIGAQEYNGNVLGDVNCDNRFDNFDIDAFVLLITDITSYRDSFSCETNGDINQDGIVNFFDIDPFVELVTR